MLIAKLDFGLEASAHISGSQLTVISSLIWLIWTLATTKTAVGNGLMDFWIVVTSNVNHRVRFNAVRGAWDVNRDVMGFCAKLPKRNELIAVSPASKLADARMFARPNKTE